MQIFNFIQENWQWMVEVLAAIIALVLFIVRKKPIKVIDSVKTTILNALPIYIKEAEELIGPGKGEEKLKFVFARMVEDLKKTQPGVDATLYIDVIRDAIEDILSTPQKK